MTRIVNTDNDETMWKSWLTMDIVQLECNCDVNMKIHYEIVVITICECECELQ